MSDQSEPPTAPPTNRRRSSFVEMFNPRSSNATTSVSSSPPSAAVPATPGASQHRRGVSITTLGLNTSGSSQSSPYTAFAKQRRASIATSSGSGSPEFRNSFGDEAAVLEEDDQMRPSVNTPTSPFARRVSFGAQALRDVRQSNGAGVSGGGRRPSTSLFTLDENNENRPPSRRTSSGTAKTAGEGFNWSEALRDRTKRSPSFSSGNPFAANTNRPRATSISAQEPPKEMPKPIEAPAPRMKKPDHLGERMLRGDFMMD